MKYSSVCVMLWLVLELSDAFLYGEVTGFHRFLLNIYLFGGGEFILLLNALL